MRHELIHAFLYISIHAPTRGATKWIPCCGQSAHISIHAPARGATNSASMMSALSLFQSTLPQGERRIRIIHAVPRSISIHAPTRGATVSVYIEVPSIIISIHAPTRGATMDRPQSLSFCAISIHAPTRGATTAHRTRTASRRFQSTLPQGERLDNKASGEDRTLFQSTLPQGERHLTFKIKLAISCISIHAPTRGATRGGAAVSEHERDFNPRSHKGSDSNFTQNSISVLFHFYQSFPHIIFPHTARFRLLIIFCTFFLVRIAQRFPVCFHFAPKQYPAFYNVCSTDLL